LVFSQLVRKTGTGKVISLELEKVITEKKLSLELELRLLAKSYPLSPCGKRNPLSQSTPLWLFSAFRKFIFFHKAEICFESVITGTGTGKANFTMVGVSVRSLLSWLAGPQSKK
jgi:hypothetical protein